MAYPSGIGLTAMMEDLGLSSVEQVIGSSPAMRFVGLDSPPPEPGFP